MLFYIKFFQNLLLPRVLTLLVFGILIVMIGVQYIFHLPFLNPAPPVWIGMMCLYFLTLFISIPRSFYSLETIRALSQVPLLMFSMLRAVLQMKKAYGVYSYSEIFYIGE